jgi:two-component system phosphate regulon sensor histidine kinase PhoR
LVVVRTLLIVGALLLIAAVLGLLDHQVTAIWILITGLCSVIAYNTVYVARLHHWSGLPRNRELPLGVGVWGQTLDRISRFMRQDAIERSETAAELERLHAAVDLLPDGLVVLDRFDHVQWSNRAAQRIHGIFGTRRPIDHFVRQPEFLDYLRANDFSEAVALSLPGQPGRVFAMKIEPTVDAFRLLITRDITEANLLEQVRRDFVANVSHEIRTPLTVVSGFVETLMEIELPPQEQMRCLELIKRQTVTMERLVEDLLTLSSLESANLQAEATEVAIGPMLQTLVADSRVFSAGRHKIEVSVDAVESVRGVSNELDSAIRNLLTNAVRYTPEGGSITASWRVVDGEGVLAVTDTGIGIAAEHLPRLTERFYRVDRGRSREMGGTGLGLAIVKHVAQRHQARLDIDSRVGAGSTFRLHFPRSLVVMPTRSRPPVSIAAADAGADAAADAAADADTEAGAGFTRSVTPST